MSVPGARVEHPVWGLGVVTRLVNGGRQWVVVLDGKPRTPVMLAAKDLRVLGGKAVATAPAPPPEALRTVRMVNPAAARPPTAREPSPVLDHADARQSLEALRLGVVPRRGLARLTVGREQELKRIRALAENAGGMVVLSGGYGSGKTHLVELAEAEALAANMLVARATFDPIEIPPSHPLRVYGALASGIRYPDGPGRGLAPLFDRLASSRAHTDPRGASFHRWLSPVLWVHARYGGGELAADLLEWVEGTPQFKEELQLRLSRSGWEGPKLLTLRDYRTFGQIMAHLLGGIAQWARDAGWRGLLVCLDEAEYFDHLDSTAREMAENVLRYLAVATLPDEALPFNPARLYRGGHRVHRSIPTRFRSGQPLAAICAFTPNPRIDEALPRVVGGAQVLPVEPVSPSQFPKLADQVLELVREVHPSLDPPDAHRRQVKRALADAWEDGRIDTTRKAARMLIELWDLYRIDPARALRALGT